MKRKKRRFISKKKCINVLTTESREPVLLWHLTEFGFRLPVGLQPYDVPNSLLVLRFIGLSSSQSSSNQQKTLTLMWLDEG